MTGVNQGEPVGPSDSSDGIASKWQSLSEEAKEACVYLLVSDRIAGLDKEDFGNFGVSEEAINEAVNSGLVESKNRQEFAKQFVEEHREEVKNIRERIRRRTLEKIFDESTNVSATERALLDAYDNEVRVTKVEEMIPSYRFVSDEVFEFVENNAE